jgi:hypothetical protein
MFVCYFYGIINLVFISSVASNLYFFNCTLYLILHLFPWSLEKHNTGFTVYISIINIQSSSHASVDLRNVEESHNCCMYLPNHLGRVHIYFLVFVFC